MNTSMHPAYDEMVSGSKSLRPHWRELMSLVWGIPPDVMREKQTRAAGHLTAADQFLPEAAAQTEWNMDLLPLILPEPEWRSLAAGLAQRAKLLNLILADIYGPQSLIRERLLPPYLVFNNPGFLRPLRFVAAAGDPPPLHVYAADLVRRPDGQWRVLADRTQAPGGIGYALRHRSIAARSFPEAFRNTSLHRLQPSIDLWQSSLQAIGAAFDENPGIVLLTPGPHNPAYSEHVLLAHELGITLAQGFDLTVREGMVYLKALNGLVRIHVIYRRVDGDYCDPLELRSDSTLGVAGLIAAARAGNVAILNLPGSAVIETPAFAPFLPAIARRLLNEELALPAVTTWWCGQKGPLAEVLNAPDGFILQPAFDPDPVPIDPAMLANSAKAELLASLKATPENYVAVERVQHSRVPTLGNHGIDHQPVVFRASAIFSGKGWVPLPGGVARIATVSAQCTPMRHGGIVKDVWILNEDSDATSARADGVGEIRKLHRVADAVSSHTADDMFWMGRYIERVDSGLRQMRAALARLARGAPGPRDLAELELLARCLQKCGWISEDEARTPVGTTVFADSIIAATGADGELIQYQLALRQLGIVLRDRLSQDTWRIVVKLSHPLLPTSNASVDLDALLGRLDDAVLSVATFNGLVAENMTRGLGWRFLEIGRRIERSVIICNAVDALFGDSAPKVELSVRLLLELSDSLITHRKRFPLDAYSLAAVGVVLSDALNPRALCYQLQSLRGLLDELVGHESLAAEIAIVERQLEPLRLPIPFGESSTSGDRLQSLAAGARACGVDLGELSDLLSRGFFSHVKATQTIVAGMSAGDRDKVAS